MDFGESRSPTEMLLRYLVPACHRLWANVCPFTSGLMDMMVMAMVMTMAMAMVMVMVMVMELGW
jgi:hypothetical protein